MKRFLAFLLMFLMITPVFAEEIIITTGSWDVGEDIPAGEYMLRPEATNIGTDFQMYQYSIIQPVVGGESKVFRSSMYNTLSTPEIRIVLVDGDTLIIATGKSCDVRLTPIVEEALITITTDFDLSGMSYEELVALKDRINLAMWQSEEWQEVIVPQGLYEVGKDIPAGHWTIKCAGTYFASIEVCDMSDSTGKDVDPYSYSSKYYWGEEVYNPSNMLYNQYNDLTECDIELKEGLYVVVKYSSVIFTPYTGKPDLGFK